MKREPGQCAQCGCWLGATGHQIDEAGTIVCKSCFEEEKK